MYFNFIEDRKIFKREKKKPTEKIKKPFPKDERVFDISLKTDENFKSTRGLGWAKEGKGSKREVKFLSLLFLYKKFDAVDSVGFRCFHYLIAFEFLKDFFC